MSRVLAVVKKRTVIARLQQTFVARAESRVAADRMPMQPELPVKEPEILLPRGTYLMMRKGAQKLTFRI